MRQTKSVTPRATLQSDGVFIRRKTITSDGKRILTEKKARDSQKTGVTVADQVMPQLERNEGKQIIKVGADSEEILR